LCPAFVLVSVDEADPLVRAQVGEQGLLLVRLRRQLDQGKGVIAASVVEDLVLAKTSIVPAADLAYLVPPLDRWTGRNSCPDETHPAILSLPRADCKSLHELVEHGVSPVEELQVRPDALPAIAEDEPGVVTIALTTRIDAARGNLRSCARLVGMVENEQLILPVALARHVGEDARPQSLALSDALYARFAAW
jgi:hypothetical protein